MSKVIIYDSPPPTYKQYKFAKSISHTLGIEMPEADDYSVEGFKSYISKHSEKFYVQQNQTRDNARMLDLIQSMDAYEREFEISN